MKENYDEYAILFKALSDTNRLLIIDYLLESERCACKILEQLQISQSTLSYHMKILCDTAIVTARKEGKWMHYSINKDKFDHLTNILNKFSYESSDDRLECSCK